MIGLFGLLIMHAKKLSQIIRQNVELQIFLNNDLTESELLRIEKTIASKDYVLKDNNNPQVRLITKEEAAKQFIDDTGEDFVDFLGDNPLRDVFILKVREEYQSQEKLKNIEADLGKINDVYEINYVESIVKSINDNLTKISVILVSFSVILFLVVSILINNTIKLALFSQRFLIRSMQLVGAKKTFIKKPFLLRASWYGFIAAILAIVMLYGLLTLGNQKIEDLQSLQEDKYLIIIALGLIFLGVIVGYASTLRAMNKYLKMSLDELY